MLRQLRLALRVRPRAWRAQGRLPRRNEEKRLLQRLVLPPAEAMRCERARLRLVRLLPLPPRARQLASESESKLEGPSNSFVRVPDATRTAMTTRQLPMLPPPSLSSATWRHRQADSVVRLLLLLALLARLPVMVLLQGLPLLLQLPRLQRLRM